MAERNPSKQKRAAQNKAQREALATRRARAAAAPKPPPSRAVAADEVVESAEKPARRRSRFRATSEKTESGRPSRSAPQRPTATSSSTARTSSAAAAKAPAPTTRSGRPIKEIGPDHPTEPGLRGFIAHLQDIAGGKAVLFAFIFSVVAAGLVLFGQVVQRSGGIAMAQIVNPLVGSAPKDALETATHTDGTNIIEAIGPAGILLALVPVVITGIALEGSRRGKRRRLYTIAAFALGLYVVFMTFIGIFYFFSMGGLFFAAWQARKADPPVPRTRAKRGAAVDDDGDDEA